MNLPGAKLSNSKRNQIIKKLTERFNYDKIINEEQYIKNMSPNMMIRIEALQKDQIFKNLSLDVIQQILKEVPLFRINKTHVKIQYENAQKILIITGIKKDIINDFVDQWLKDYNRRSAIVKEINMGCWHTIEFTNADMAQSMKKFIRTKKAQKDSLEKTKRDQKYKRQQEGYCGYKYPNRRVRIVRLRDEFFSILVDLMAQTMNEKFCQAIESRGDSLVLLKGLAYIPLYTFEKNEQKQEQIDDAVSSQMLSHTSQAYDPYNRMRDIDIQTANQGTQIQINGFQIQTESTYEMKEEKIIEKAHSQTASITKKHQDENNVIFNGHLSQIIDQQQSNYQAHFCPKTHLEVNGSKHRSNSAVLLENSSHSVVEGEKTITFQANKVCLLQQEFPVLQNPTQQTKQTMSNMKQRLHEQVTALSRIQFGDMKRKYNEFLKYNQGKKQMGIPEYIRKESEGVTYKRKFHHQIIRKAEQYIRRLSQF